MNKLILCEGATDAILLSYYLERTAGWKFVRQPPQGVSIRATEQNEEVTWYKKNNDYLLICAVGGKDNFGKFFDDKIQKPLVMSDAFEKIAIVADRDNREVSEIETEASAFLKVPCEIGRAHYYQFQSLVRQYLQMYLPHPMQRQNAHTL